MSDTDGPELTKWKIVLLLEFMALLIGMAMPITPSKTGSDFSLAEWFFQAPNYAQEVLVYFVLTNAVMVVLGFIAWVSVRADRRKGRPPHS
jgi:hypothetical protein